VNGAATGAGTNDGAWTNEAAAGATNEIEGRYTCAPPGAQSLDYQCQCSECYGGVIRELLMDLGTGIGQRAGGLHH
jgi:hypothetical protein